jgi:hypothetical protein
VAVFYRGAGVGTYWHTNDARIAGFRPWSPQMTPTVNCLTGHIARGTVASPFISLTRSYRVAEDYAKNAGRQRPTSSQPAYVYRIEIDDPPPVNLTLWDPIVYTAHHLPSAFAVPYQHDGPPNFLLGVVDPVGMKNYLSAPYVQPPPGGGTPRPPTLTIELETLVRALRDAEILAVGTVPAACVTFRYDVY